LYGKQSEPGHPDDTTALLSINFPSSVEEAEEAALGFQISTLNCIWNRVAAIDGYHLKITTPSKKDAESVYVQAVEGSSPTI
jgi:hypothetical protein